MPDLTRDDLRAAVSAGVLTEAQAASVAALAAQRLAGAPTSEDEPFELFSGFAEIFISVGLAILIAGVMGLTIVLQSFFLICVVGVGLSYVLARYFTLKRRMVLPSVVLVCAYALSVAPLVFWVLELTLDLDRLVRTGGIFVSGAVLLALLAWYRVFRLPFTMFLIGLSGLALVLFVTSAIDPSVLAGSGGLDDLFDLRQGSGLAVGTLIFGLIAAAVALRFDMRDPWRLGRASASAFWLHLIAAPALVNTLGMTAMNLDSGARYVAVALALAVLTAFALIIDRRSFLTAGLGYLAWLIWALAQRGGGWLDWSYVLILIGGSVTALGAWWIPLRSRLMRALPDFPGKDRLPPYAKGDL